MADDDRNRRKTHSDRDETPEWHESCIGIWSKSTKEHPVNDGDHDKICNGISVVRIHGRVRPHAARRAPRNFKSQVI